MAGGAEKLRTRTMTTSKEDRHFLKKVIEGSKGCEEG
jgi:hypothetical protein